MGHIELTLPDSLLRKAQAFEPEAQDALRDICDKCGIDAECSAIMRKDLAAFLNGQRNENKSDIDRITDLLKNAEIVYTIQNCGKYYIIELIRHYCDIAMKWEAFGEIFPMNTGDGRIFYRDFCAIAIMYLEATSSELEAIGTQDIDFEQHGLRGTDANGNEFEFEARSQDAYLRAAKAKAKEWRKFVATGTPDAELGRKVEMYQIVKPCADAYMTTETKKNLIDAIEEYNSRNEVPATMNYVSSVIMGVFAGLMQRTMQPVETSERMIKFSGTGEELFCTLMNASEHPDNTAFCGFLSALGVLRDFDLNVDEQFIKYRKKDGKAAYHTKRYSYRIVQANVLPVPQYAKDKDGNVLTDANGKKMLSVISRRERIELISDKRFVSGYRHKINIDKATLPQRPDVKYLLPASTYDNVKDTEFWTDFILTLKGNTNLNEDELLERVYHYADRKARITADAKLTEHEKADKWNNILKNKTRDKNRLKDAFVKAEDDGIIQKNSARRYETTKKKNGTSKRVWIWKWKHIATDENKPETADEFRGYTDEV